MNVQIVKSDILTHPTPLLVLPLFKGTEEMQGVLSAVDELVEGALRRAVSAGDFSGKAESTLLLYPPGGSSPERILILGLGNEDDFNAETLRRVAGRSVRVAEGLRVSNIAIRMDAAWDLGMAPAAQAATEGSVLAAWRFSELKRGEDDGELGPEVKELSLLVDEDWEGDAREGARVGLAQARGENLARTLQSRPGNVATPTHLAEEAERLGEVVGLEVTVLGPGEMEAEGMGAILAVAQGSEQEPRLIVLEHRGGREGDPPLLLVGKGLTFDAGGISIKPASGMEDMKYDMSGGAAVFGALYAVAELGLPINVVGIVPSSENLLSGRAVKPGDVVRTREGKTVEILNTDAEGRLILCDALTYTERFNPAAVIDIATLTGACVIALGHHAQGLMSNHKPLAHELLNAGKQIGDRAWEMPLWDEYQEQLDSNFADMANIGGRDGGAITAACFLSRYTKKFKWAHLDIAGTAWVSGKEKGSTGRPVPMLMQFLINRSSQS